MSPRGLVGAVTPVCGFPQRGSPSGSLRTQGAPGGVRDPDLVSNGSARAGPDLQTERACGQTTRPDHGRARGRFGRSGTSSGSSADSGSSCLPWQSAWPCGLPDVGAQQRTRRVDAIAIPTRRRRLRGTHLSSRFRKASIARSIASNHSSDRLSTSAIFGFLPSTTTHHVQ